MAISATIYHQVCTWDGDEAAPENFGTWVINPPCAEGGPKMEWWDKPCYSGEHQDPASCHGGFFDNYPKHPFVHPYDPLQSAKPERTNDQYIALGIKIGIKDDLANLRTQCSEDGVFEGMGLTSRWVGKNGVRSCYLRLMDSKKNNPNNYFGDEQGTARTVVAGQASTVQSSVFEVEAAAAAAAALRCQRCRVKSYLSCRTLCTTSEAMVFSKF